MFLFFVNMFIYLSVFFIGTIVGSFLNVIIWRTKNQTQKFSQRSECFFCHKQLSVKSLVPIWSFILQKGISLCCNKKVPIQYVYVEFVAGISFLITYYVFGISLFSFILFPSIATLILLGFYDVLYGELPHKWTLFVSVYIIITRIVLGQNLLPFVIAMVIGGVFFLVQILVSKGKWVGGGDVGMGILIGAIVGWPVLLVSIFFSYIIGAVHVLILLLLKKIKMGQVIPFGGYLVAGTLIGIFYGREILDWYIKIANL